MGRIFIDGFESGSADLWDTVTGDAISSTGKDMDGSYCLDLAWHEYAEQAITLDDEMYFAFLYRPYVASAQQMLSVYNAGTVLVHIIRNSASSLIEAKLGATTTIATGSKALAVDTTYLIEVHFKIADTGGRIEVKVDNISDIDFTGDTKPGADTQFNKVRLGEGPYGSYNSYAYFDNLIMDDTAWIGDTSIQALVPTAGGNSTGWTPSAGSNFACVDEIPHSDTDYVSINANDVVDTYVTGDLSGSIDNIKCIQVQSRTRTEGTPTPKNLKLVVRSGSTDYLSGNKVVPAVEKGLFNLWETDPATSATWLESGVNGIEIGIKSAA